MAATKKANLPGNIIETNILKRLPVKTLIRFTSVCKSWYSLLSDPYFINIYNDQIHKNKISNLLFVDYYNNRIVVTDSRSNEQSSFSNNRYRRVDVIGCCDGIVCVSGISYDEWPRFIPRLDISLWNPALRINKIVATNYETSAHRLYRLCFGFGYHNKTNDYNVIRFSNDLMTTLNNNHVVEVYSLTSDSWRTVQLSGQILTAERYIYTVEKFGVYVSNCYAYCWMALKCRRNDCVWEARIISFHMEEEDEAAFKEMALPYTTGVIEGNTLFIYKNDSLAVLHTHDSYAVKSTPKHVSRIFYIWVMKRFGDPNSWTKLWKFDSQRPYVGVSFLGVIETNLILLRFDEKKVSGTITTPKEVNVFDIEKSQTNPISYTKDISFLAKAKRITSITESLALL